MRSNTSGSGFAAKLNSRITDNKIWISKGYRDADKLIENIKTLNLGVDDELIIHHRIPTSGAIDNLNCHPFIISDIEEEAITLEGFTAKPVIAHNGIFNGPGKRLNKLYSDTYHFTKEFLAIPEIFSLLLRDSNLFGITFGEWLGCSKFGILFSDRDFFMFGDYWQEDSGYHHSNGGYKDYSVRNIGGVEKTVTTSEDDGIEYPFKDNYFPTHHKCHISHNKIIGFNRFPEDIREQEPMRIVPRENKQHIVLNDYLININSINCHHFYLVAKGGEAGLSIKKDDRFIMSTDKADDSTGNVWIQLVDNEFKPIPRKTWLRCVKNLFKSFYIVPMPQYETTYRDYCKMKDRTSATTDACKALLKLINKPTTSVKVKNVGKNINKEAVKMVYNEYVAELGLI